MKGICKECGEEKEVRPCISYTVDKAVCVCPNHPRKINIEDYYVCRECCMETCGSSHYRHDEVKDTPFRCKEPSWDDESRTSESEHGKEWVDGVAPLKTRTKVKTALMQDPNLQRKMKKTLLFLWDQGLVYVFPNETIMLTEKGSALGKELNKDSEYKGGYSSEILAMFKNMFSDMKEEEQGEGD